MVVGDMLKIKKNYIDATQGISNVQGHILVHFAFSVAILISIIWTSIYGFTEQYD